MLKRQMKVPNKLLQQIHSQDLHMLNTEFSKNTRKKVRNDLALKETLV